MASAEPQAAVTVEVELVYSPAARQAWTWQGRLPAGATLADAVAASGVEAAHPGLDRAAPVCGIWGRRSSPDTPLRDGDRVELYRPLTVDPMEARRRRQHIQAERG